MNKYATLLVMALALTAASADGGGRGGRALGAPAPAPAMDAGGMTDPGMQAAMDAVQQLGGFLKDRVEGFLNKVDKIETEVEAWAATWTKISGEDLTKYRSNVAKATIYLSNAKTDAKNIVEQLENTLTLALNQLNSALANPGTNNTALKEAIHVTKLACGVALTQGAASLKSLKDKLVIAQTTFATVAAESKTFVDRIDNSIAGKDDTINAKVENIRIQAYASCAGVCVVTLGIGCPACYAIAAGIVETKVKELKDVLRASLKQMQGLATLFKETGETATQLSAAATAEYNSVSKTASEVESSASIVNASEAIPWYAGIVVPKLKELCAYLRTINDAEPMAPLVMMAMARSKVALRR